MQNKKEKKSERVVVTQDKSFRTEFNGMLLASVSACTAIVVNSYARNHDIPLKGVTVDASYDRVFRDDCEDCDGSNAYEEIIRESVEFEGKLDEKLLRGFIKSQKHVQSAVCWKMASKSKQTSAIITQ